MEILRLIHDSQTLIYKKNSTRNMHAVWQSIWHGDWLFSTVPGWWNGASRTWKASRRSRTRAAASDGGPDEPWEGWRRAACRWRAEGWTAGPPHQPTRPVRLRRGAWQLQPCSSGRDRGGGRPRWGPTSPAAGTTQMIAAASTSILGPRSSSLSFSFSFFVCIISL